MSVANISKNTHDAFVPEIWSASTRDATESNLVMAKLVNTDFEGEITAAGDVVHINDISNLTAQNKAHDTDVSFESPAESGVDITIDKHKYTAFKVEDIIKVQSRVDLMDKYTNKAGYPLAKAIDTDLLGLYSGFSQSVGSAGSTSNLRTNIIRAVQYMDDADAPSGDRFAAIKPSLMAAMLDTDGFVLATDVGYTVETSPIVTGVFAKGQFDPKKVKGLLGQFFGVTFYVTTNVPTTGTSPVATHNLIFHREAMALAVQKQIRIQSDYNIRSLATEVVADVMYGVKEYRDAFGVQLLS